MRAPVPLWAVVLIVLVVALVVGLVVAAASGGVYGGAGAAGGVLSSGLLLIRHARRRVVEAAEAAPLHTPEHDGAVVSIVAARAARDAEATARAATQPPQGVVGAVHPRPVLAPPRDVE